MLKCVVAARQLWCWVQHWRYDLGTLMKCVCKVSIYHPPKNQHAICSHHDSALLQPAMNTGEIYSPRKWKHKHFVTIACLQSKRFLRQDGVREVYDPIAEHTQLFEHHFCDLWIAPVTRHLIVGACDFSNLIGSQKYFYARRIISSHSS